MTENIRRVSQARSKELCKVKFRGIDFADIATIPEPEKVSPSSPRWTSRAAS